MSTKWFMGFAIIVVFLFGCDNLSTNQVQISPTTSVNVVLAQANYFPMQVGSSWNYKITVQDNSYTYYEQLWPMGKTSLGYAVTGFLYPDEKDSAKYLAFTVDSTATKQGPFSYPDGVKLLVTKDDAEIFRDAKDLYYNVTHDSGGMIQVQLVTTYDVYSPNAPQYAMEDGYAVRMVFYTVDPDTFMYALSHPENTPLVRIGLNESKDTLVFMGLENTVPGYSGQVAMHFRRELAADDQSISFNEDLWFISGVGLVRMVQTSGGGQTMVWDLVPTTKATQSS